MLRCDFAAVIRLTCTGKKTKELSSFLVAVFTLASVPRPSVASLTADFGPFHLSFLPVGHVFPRWARNLIVL